MSDNSHSVDSMPRPGPKPFESLWFSDGNVVLMTDTYLFKVHKGMLSSQSSVFRDMFDLPLVDRSEGTAGGNGGIMPETYDGLPLVKFSYEKGEEFAYLLRAVYERQFYHRDDDRTPLKVVTSLLVLSTKYDFKHIRKDVVFQISKHYPMKLDEYCAIDDENSKLFGEDRKDCHFPLLGAAFTAQLDILLPILYYAASQFPAGYIFQAYTSGIISMECCKTLLEGRDVLIYAVNSFIARLREKVEPRYLLFKDKGCQAQGCNLDPPDDHWLQKDIRPDDFVKSSNLKNLEGRRLVGVFFPQVCSDCLPGCAKDAESDRDFIWGWIPMTFEKVEWEELQGRLEKLLSEDV